MIELVMYYAISACFLYFFQLLITWIWRMIRLTKCFHMTSSVVSVLSGERAYLLRRLVLAVCAASRVFLFQQQQQNAEHNLSTACSSAASGIQISICHHKQRNTNYTQNNDTMNALCWLFVLTWVQRSEPTPSSKHHIHKSSSMLCTPNAVFKYGTLMITIYTHNMR